MAKNCISIRHTKVHSFPEAEFCSYFGRARVKPLPTHKWNSVVTGNEAVRVPSLNHLSPEKSFITFSSTSNSGNNADNGRKSVDGRAGQLNVNENYVNLRESEQSKNDIWVQDDEILLAQKAALLRAKMKRRQVESTTSKKKTPEPSSNEKTIPKQPAKPLPNRIDVTAFDSSKPFDPSFQLDSSDTRKPQGVPSSAPRKPVKAVLNPLKSIPNFGQMRTKPDGAVDRPRLERIVSKARESDVAAEAPVSSPDMDNLGSDETLAKLKRENEALFADVLEKQRLMEEMALRENQLQEEFKQETHAEMQRIKASLESREDDLAMMVKELEEAKAQFNMIRVKTSAELAQARQLLAENESQLMSAKTALSRLKQVKVEYWGQGASVKMGGSFNGWTETVELVPDPSSAVNNLDGSSGPMMWEVDMYLYPGIYEVKFLVDGEWTVDTRRELKMGDIGQNNVLRVEQEAS